MTKDHIETRDEKGELKEKNTSNPEFESVSADGSINGRVQVRPGDDVQSKLDQAGPGWTLDFAPGSYPVGTPVNPHPGQTLHLGHSVKFEPTADTTVWDFAGAHNCEVLGELNIVDPNHNTVNAAAAILQNVHGAYFERIRSEQTARPVVIQTGAGGDAYENVITSIQVNGYRKNGIELSGEIHDNHFQDIWLTGQENGVTASGDGVLINTDKVDGGNMINSILSLSAGLAGIHVENQHREMWIGDAILDSCGQDGFNYTAGGNRALFLDSLWTSGNGRVGTRISGSSTNSINQVQIGQLFAIGNAAAAASMEHTDGLMLGRMYAENNAYGLRFANGTSTNAYVDYIHSHSNNGNDLDGLSAGSNVHINRANVGVLANESNFASLNGAPLPTNLSGTTGSYPGEVKLDDGTNTPSANPAICVWVGGTTGWQVQGTSTTFT